MSQPPVKPGEAAASLNARIARLREATGRPERLRLACRCSRTNKNFHIEFERLHADKKFEIAKIVKEEDGATGAGGANTPDAWQTHPVSMISCKGFACPWCAAGSLTYHGTCVTMWCSQSGKSEFTCPTCKISFREQPLRELRGLQDAGASGASKMLGAAASLFRLGKPR